MLNDILTINRVFLELKAENKEDFLEKMYLKLIENSSEAVKDKEKVFQCLIKREQSMTTGIGYGLAIPHCICPEVNKMTCAAALIPEGLDFEAYDEEPVYFVFMTIANPGEQKTHIANLQKLSKIFQNDVLREAIYDADDEDEVFAFLENNWD